MRYSDESYNLRIKLDTENCEFNEDDIQRLEADLNPLREPVRGFPVSNLYLTFIRHARSHQYRVKAALVLPGKTLATGDLDERPALAFRRCVRKLIQKVEAYKQRMSNSEESAKHEEGTRQDVSPTQAPDTAAIAAAVETGDYAAFRKQTFVYEESVRKRAGRWINRYPRAQQQLDEQFTLADVVEEVFLNAFERFGQRSADVDFGCWLEELIDPSVRALLSDRDEEQQNISFARSAREVE